MYPLVSLMPVLPHQVGKSSNRQTLFFVRLRRALCGPIESSPEAMKVYLKGQRSMVLARYNLFTRRQKPYETFEEWLSELRKLYDLAEAEDMTGDDLLTVLITTGIREEKVRSKILEELRTPTLDDTIKLIAQMVHARDTNASIAKRREDSKVAAISASNTHRKPRKTSYQKNKDTSRFERANNKSKFGNTDQFKGECYYCGKDRHTSNGTTGSWRENCIAKNHECKDCKKIGHFPNMPACRLKKVNCIKIENLNSIRDTNAVTLKALGPDCDLDFVVEADTGASVTLFSSKLIEDMPWINLESTDMHVKGFNSSIRRCKTMAKIELRLGKKTHEETIYFSDHTDSNFLSRGACKALYIIHAGFPTEQVSSMQLDGIASGQNPMRKKSVKSGCGQNPMKIDGDNLACGQNPMDFNDVNLASGQNPMRQKNGKLASGQNPTWN